MTGRQGQRCPGQPSGGDFFKSGDGFVFFPAVKRLKLSRSVPGLNLRLLKPSPQ